LETRHDLGERDARTAVDDFRVELALLLAAVAIEIDDETAVVHDRVDVTNVEARGFGGESLRVCGGERAFESAVQLDAGFLAFTLHEVLVQPTARPDRGLGA